MAGQDTRACCGWGRGRRGHGARSRVGRGRAQPPKPPCPNPVEMTSSHARATRRAATLRLVRCPAGWMLALTRTPPAKTRRHAIGSDSTPLVYLSIYTWTYSETIECILLFVMVAASGCRLMLHIYAVATTFVHFDRLQDTQMQCQSIQR